LDAVSVPGAVLLVTQPSRALSRSLVSAPGPPAQWSTPGAILKQQSIRHRSPVSLAIVVEFRSPPVVELRNGRQIVESFIEDCQSRHAGTAADPGTAASVGLQLDIPGRS
jgi:hypothetical protein